MGQPANVSRDYYNLSANRMALIFQQGKSVLDAELNQIQQILRDQNKLLALHAIGNGFLGDSFLVMSSTTPNQIKINKGFFYWNGTCVYLPSDVYISTLSTPLTPTRTDIVWVEFLDLDNDSTEDTDLFDTVLGRETVHSLKRTVNIYVSEGTEPTPLTGNTNWFIIAKLQRLGGDSQVHDSSIIDQRVETANTFVDDGLRVENGSTSTEYTWTEGRSTVANEDYFHPVPGTSLPPVYANYSFDLAPTTGLPQDMIVTAKISGNAGNYISLAFIHPSAASQPLSISVTGTSIVVNYSTDTFGSINSTLYQVQQLINTDSLASQLVQASLVPGVDVNAITGQAYLTTFLQNGQDGIPGIRYAPLNNSVYVYVDKNGDIVNSLVRPADFHAVLAKVTSGSSGIVNIDDMRMFRPAANRGGLANKDFSEGGQIPSEGGSTEKDFLVDEFISAYNVVTYGSSPDSIRNANGIDDTRVPAFAITVRDLLPGQRSVVLIKGEVNNTSWSWTPEQPLYLDITSGQITQTDHNTAGTVSQYLGYALTATKIWFDPDQTYIKN